MADVDADSGVTGLRDAGRAGGGEADAGRPDASVPAGDSGVTADASVTQADAGMIELDGGSFDASVSMLTDGGSLDAGQPPRRDGGPLELSFELALAFPAGEEYHADRWARPADFNGDGLTDFVTGGEDELDLLISSADAGFLAPVVLAKRQFACGLAADFDGDGHLDLFVDDQYTQKIMRGRGDGTFEAAVTSPSVLYLCGKSVHQTDAGAELINTNGVLQRLRFDGVSMIDAGVLPPLVGAGPVESSLFADITGDGRDDFIALRGVGISVFAGNGTFTGFDAPVDTVISGCTSGRAIAGHFDADAYADLAVFSNCGLKVAYGSSTGALTRVTVNLFTERAFKTFAVADLNGDGLSDLVFDIYGLDTNNPRPHYIAIVMNRGAGVFELTDRLTSTDEAYNIVVGRFDHDSLPDLYLAGTWTMFVARGNPTSVFSLGHLFNQDEHRITSRFGSQGAAFMNLDADGQLDALTAATRDGGLRVFSGDGHGRFAPTSTVIPTLRATNVLGLSQGRFGPANSIALSYYSDPVDVMDFVNGALVQSSSTNQSVFYPKAAPPLFADLNGDGRDELIFHRFTEVAVMHRVDAGVFTQQLVPSLGGVGGVAVADFDLDGRPDILSYHWDAKAILIHHALEDGGFSDGGVLRTPNECAYARVADVDADGRPDVTAWEEYAYTTYLFDNGVNGFSDAGFYDQYQRVVSTIDLDGDGVPERIVGGAIYRAHGTTEVGSIRGAQGAQFIDVNRDGLPDLVVPHFEGGVSIHLNTSH